jgi:hypothetical protein
VASKSPSSETALNGPQSDNTGVNLELRKTEKQVCMCFVEILKSFLEARGCI